ncbi:MAG: hypothetical protein RIF36_00025 [Imperialibacter sp.]|uniref:hypothetical protein n=1 Tax=Imperialibacter sp. TaxID=2038411 RepID=UPI0032EC4692
MSKVIGKIAATEKAPTTIDEFYFWTDKQRILSPFDVVKVNHINSSSTFGVIEEISHITDSSSYLANFISSDFGDVTVNPNTNRIGMNFVKAKVVGNSKSIYIPVLDGALVSLANKDEVAEALGLDKIDNKLSCGYLEMYEGEDKIELPVYINSNFLTGPEGAHLNISGISGLASKTSYAMFLLKSIQHKYQNKLEELAKDENRNESVAFVIFNVKGKDLLGIDEANKNLQDDQRRRYEYLGIDPTPFTSVKYFYPYAEKDKSESSTFSYGHNRHILSQVDEGKAFRFKYPYDEDIKKSIDMMFSNVDDSTGTMDSILNYIINGAGDFGNIRNWNQFKEEIDEHCRKGTKATEITVTSWRKFKRIISKAVSHDIFAPRVVPEDNEVRLKDKITEIKKGEVFVVDVAKLDQDTQAFVFGDVIRSIYDLKLGQEDRDEFEIPSKIIVFVDELNKYASNDVPKSSPILRQLLDITERGRSLGIILFSAEQFKSAIHDRVKGNNATHAYGRTNAIEISKNDYRFIPSVYKNMMTRLEPGQYIIEHPVLRSLLNIRFPKPVYNQDL